MNCAAFPDSTQNLALVNHESNEKEKLQIACAEYQCEVNLSSIFFAEFHSKHACGAQDKREFSEAKIMLIEIHFAR